MSTTTARQPHTRSGVVEFVITDDASLNTARVLHTIGGVTIEHDGHTVYVSMTMLPAVIAAMQQAIGQPEEPEPSSYIVRCERNEAERVTRTEHDARQTAARCLCGGSHTIRPSFVAWAASTF